MRIEEDLQLDSCGILREVLRDNTQMFCLTSQDIHV
jgi:hypothetical protein